MALLVDEFAKRGILCVESVTDVSSCLSFIPTATEASFLVKYVLWRLGQAKPAGA